MRVLMITQKVDSDDDVLGFTHDWIAALARHVDALDVLALSTGRYALPENVTVTSMGKEEDEDRSRPLLLLGFYRGLARLLPQADAVFVHMVPRYAVLAAPVALLFGKPITLWYTHRSVSAELRLAARLVQHIATAHETSFPLPGDKVQALGHGIDPVRYFPPEAVPDGVPMVINLARLSPIKRQDTMIRAAALLRDKYDDPPARYVIAGGRPAADPTEYEEMLESEIDRLRLGDRVTFWGAIPSDGVTALFHKACISFNGSPPGLFDKAVLEGMLCGVPTIVANPAFDDLLGEYSDLLRIPEGGDDAALADRLARLLAMPAGERRAIGLALRERVLRDHSLDRLMSRLAALLAS